MTTPVVQEKVEAFVSISKDLLVVVEKEVEALGKVTKKDEDVMEKNTKSDAEATQGTFSRRIFS